MSAKYRRRHPESIGNKAVAIPANPEISQLSKTRGLSLLSKNDLEPQRYGSMFPNESALQHAVDRQIIRLRDSKEIKDIIDR